MIELDISEVIAFTREMERSLDRDQPREMKRILDKAAREEVRTHEYNNITGLLEANTYASPIIGFVDGYMVELGARREYASHVAKRQRTRIHEIAQQAAVEVDFYLDGEATRLGSL
jgi:hypothetical protein